MPATLTRKVGISFATVCLSICFAGCGQDDSAPPAATDNASTSDMEAELGRLRSELDSHAATAPATPDELAGTDALLSGARGGDAGQGWGNLSVRFVYEGQAPVPAPIQVTNDQDFCCRTPLLMENLVVNARNRGIANIVVCLYTGRGETPPAPHPSYEESAGAIVTLDNASCRFEPHVCLLRTSQTLRVNNKDEVSHNTNTRPAEQSAVQRGHSRGWPCRQETRGTGSNTHPHHLQYAPLDEGVPCGEGYSLHGRIRRGWPCTY